MEQIVDVLVLHMVEQLGDAVWEPILVLQMVQQLVGEEDETELHSQFATLRRFRDKVWKEREQCQVVDALENRQGSASSAQRVQHDCLQYLLYE